MKVYNVGILDIHGKAIKKAEPGVKPGEERDLLVVDVLVDAALAPRAQGASYTPEEAAERVSFARAVKDTMVGGEFEVPSKLAAQLDADVARYFPVIVAAAIHEQLK